ncbi:MAG TPA: hypothetical protein VE521_00830 [Nitrososphaera sp.]|nr:hypothetical protein [Nitrososphaera sp.]
MFFPPPAAPVVAMMLLEFMANRTVQIIIRPNVSDVNNREKQRSTMSSRFGNATTYRPCQGEI